MVRVLALMVLTFSLGSGTSFAQQSADPHSGMHHSFENAEQWAKQFDDPNRDAWQKPDEVLDALRLAPTAIVADLGAGTGYFSVQIAKRVPQGKVYAVDIEPDMLRYLDERKHHEHLSVLQPVQASADAAHLPEPVDLVLVVDTYHHIDNRTAYFDVENVALVHIMKAAIAARHGGVLPKTLSDEDARTASQAAITWQAKQAADNTNR